MFSPIRRREDAGCHLHAGENNFIFRAYEYRSRKVSLDFLGKEENDAPGDDSDNITVNPVVIGVNIGPDNQQPTSAEYGSTIILTTVSKMKNFIKENLHVCDALATLAGHVKIDTSTISSGASLLRGPICGEFQTVDKGDMVV